MIGRLIFALMDSDGDGTVSLQEFQAAHEKIFKAMDTGKDGTLTLEEIQTFMRGTGNPGPREHEPEHDLPVAGRVLRSGTLIRVDCRVRLENARGRTMRQACSSGRRTSI